MPGPELGAMKIKKMSKTQFLPKHFETHLLMRDGVAIVSHEESMVGR